MKNINQQTQSHNEIPYTYQIVNKIPEKQAIVLQTTNKDLPLQLRVDPVTDYGALWLTVLASVLVSAITAAVTIYLITQSNNKLINSQDNLQEKMLSQQAELKKNELKSQNRQEWINRVRTLFVNYFDHTSSFITVLNKYYFKKSSSDNDEISEEEYNSMVVEYNNYIITLNKYNYEVDITLSSNDKIDREIATLVYKFHTNFILLAKELDVYYSSFSPNFQSITMSYLDNHSITQDMDLINKDILNKIKILLKSEWEKVKKFE